MPFGLIATHGMRKMSRRGIAVIVSFIALPLAAAVTVLLFRPPAPEKAVPARRAAVTQSAPQGAMPVEGPVAPLEGRVELREGARGPTEQETARPGETPAESIDTEGTTTAGSADALDSPADIAAPAPEAPSSTESPTVVARLRSKASAAQPVVPLGNWARLLYRTSKLLIFSGDITLTRAVERDIVKVRADSRARLFGSPFVDAWSVSTLDASTGRPLEFFEVRPGKKAERWVFNEPGKVLHVTLKPHKQTPDEPMAQWKSKSEILTEPVSAQGAHSTAQPAIPVASESGKPVSTASAGEASGAAADGIQSGTADASRWVHDYISMIVRLRDLPLGKVGDEAVVRISTSQGPVPMKIRVTNERREHRTLTDISTGETRRFPLRELRLRVTPLTGSPSDTRGFLDMEGETELWIEATSRAVTEISGEIPKVPGRVVITLSGYAAAQ